MNIVAPENLTLENDYVELIMKISRDILNFA